MTTDTMTSARAERIHIAGRALAITGALLGAVPCYIVFYVFDNGDEVFDYPIWGKIALCLWAIVPLPVAWWIGRSVARGTAALAVLVAGMALALAYEAFFCLTVFPLNVAAGLLVIAMPLFELLFLAVIVLLAWLTGCWTLWRSRRLPSTDH